MEKINLICGKTMSFQRWKTFLIMKLLAIFILGFVLQSFAVDLQAQNKRLTLQFENASLKEILQKLEDQSDFSIIYKDELINAVHNISGNFKEEKVVDLLDKILQNTNLKYTLEGQTIIILPKNNPSVTEQQKSVSGRVTDSTGGSLPGVSVVVKGTTNGMITDAGGKYSLTNIPENTILQFSFIGMKSQEVKVGAQSVINIKLEDETIGIEEVVAIGYGTMKKSDLTGSVVQLKTQQFETQQASNLLQYLTGTVAGVTVNNSTSAAGSSAIEVRGPTSLNANNAPLIVLDGVIFNGNINDISPSDIESIDILKDASSSAVFGARSAAGVVIVNTKKGKGEKVDIDISAQLGLTSTTNEILPCNPEQYLDYRTDFLTRVNPSQPVGYYDNPNSLPPGVTLDAWQKYDATVNPDPQDAWMNRLKLKDIEKKNLNAGKTYDWYDAAMRQGFRQNYDVNLKSGAGLLKYYWSNGYTSNKNYILGDDYKIFRSRLNTEATVTDFLKFGLNAQFSSKDQSNVALNLGSIMNQSPYGQPFDDAGVLKWYPHDDSVIPNPFINYYNYDKFNKAQNLFATMYGEITFPMGFSFKSSFINRYDWNKNFYYDPSTTPNGNKTKGYGQRINSSLYEWQLDNILTWKKKFGVHDFNATLLYSAEKRQTWNDQDENIGFITSEALGYHQLNAGSSPTIVDNDTYSTGTAMMGRLNYILMSKYFLTLTYRRDGYSAFGQAHPYANFPSAALGWNVKNEKFFKVSWINNLKLRLSYGVNGNRDIGIYDALAQLATTKYLSGTTVVSGIYSATMANSDLRWERTTSFNGGLDFGFLEGKISGNIDVYKAVTTDLLLRRSLPAIIGFKSVMSNMGQLDNKGFEFTLNTRNYAKSNFSWNSSLVFSFNRNKIVHLYGDMVDIKDASGKVIGTKEADDKTNGWFIGESIDRIWDYRSLGIWQLGEENAAKSFGKSPGDVKLFDPDGNGVSTQEDKEFLGYRKPRYNIGFRNDISFLKNFSFSCFIRADLGQMSTNNLLMHTNQTEDRQNAYNLPYWTPTNPINNYTRLNTVDTPAYTLYESRGFVRLQDASFSYNIPRDFIQKAKINNCRLYLSGRNLLTFTKWSGWDPESGNTPMPLTVTFGIDLAL
jgi:TonB-linked SusC/RagA family outer membrane protein